MRRRRARRGLAAVEMALLLPLFVSLLVFPLFLGRVFWHYTAIERAAQDAARYLSRVPLGDMNNPARAPAAAVAGQIVAAELAELSPGSIPYGLTTLCDGQICIGVVTPSTVTVNIQLYLEDTSFSWLTWQPLPLVVEASYPYIGR